MARESGDATSSLFWRQTNGFDLKRPFSYVYSWSYCYLNKFLEAQAYFDSFFF